MAASSRPDSPARDSGGGEGAAANGRAALFWAVGGEAVRAREKTGEVATMAASGPQSWAGERERIRKGKVARVILSKAKRSVRVLQPLFCPPLDP